MPIRLVMIIYILILGTTQGCSVNRQPVANAGNDQTVSVTDTVQLDGSGSSDPNGDQLTLAWSFISKPSDSNALLSDPTVVNPTFKADKMGSYEVQLIVNDGKLDSVPDTVSVKAINDPPIITSSPVAKATEGKAYIYDVEATDPNAGDKLTFSLDQSPTGMTIDAATGLINWTPTAAQVGTQEVVVRVTDKGGLFVTQPFTITVAAANHPPTITSTPITTGKVGEPYGYTITASDADNDPLVYTLTAAPIGMTINSTSGVISWAPDAVGDFDVAVKVSDGQGGAATQAFTLHIAPKSILPPDPSTVAPPVDPTVVTTLHSATAFLYTGVSPIQTGVAPGTIEPKRAAVLRGKILDQNRNPLPGVTVTILHHPEFGQTLSREDGMFDLAVNGGGYLTANYEKVGYLSAQRQVNVPWQDYVWLPEVLLVPLDAQVTTINLAAPVAMQVARGSVTTDEDGARQTTLLFPQGASAQMVLPDGSTRPITSLNVRATEYSIGPDGLGAMPAELPNNTGYTYAVEFTVDEAVAAEAKNVKFSRPVINYLENFLGAKVGSAVPVGYYDRTKAAWIAADNGLVVQILSIDNGLAALDVDGSKQPADAAKLAALGITDTEQHKLAELYTPGQSLWRVSISHFSPWDINWPFGPPPDAISPNVSPPRTDDPIADTCETAGSRIECENQTLSEAIDVTGTPLRLHYQSDRVPGRKAAYTLQIPLSGAGVPASLIGIELKITVAGREFTHTLYKNAGCEPAKLGALDRDLPMVAELREWLREGWTGVVESMLPSAQAATLSGGAKLNQFFRPWHCDLIDSGAAQPVASLANQRYAFTWNGQDAYGRTLQGRQPVTARIGYIYRGAYQQTDRFGYNGKGMITGSRSRQTVTIWREWQTKVGGFGQSRVAGLGAWNLSVHHAYDVNGHVLYLGDGRRRQAENLNAIISRFLGNGTVEVKEGVPATESGWDGGGGMATAPDGSVYFTSSEGCAPICLGHIWRVSPSGIIHAVASEKKYGTYSSLAVAPDGGLYLATRNSLGNPPYVLRWFNGTFTVVAGKQFGYGGDDGPATEAAFWTIQDVALGADGSLYLTDTGNHRIRRVGPNGIVTTVAGTSANCAPTEGCGDGGLATQARLNTPEGITVGPDNSLYIADTGSNRIRRVSPDGIITTVAGTGSYDFTGDGGPATNATLRGPRKVAISADGSLYIADSGNGRIRRVGPDGIITTFAGHCDVETNPACVDYLRGEGGPAASADIDPWGVALGPDGGLYISGDYPEGGYIHRVAPLLPGYSVSEIVIPAEDGGEIYIFSHLGRHLRTLNAFTGATLYEFSYDSAGRLAQIKDGDKNVTTIERDAEGKPMAILAPFGQRTTLQLDANGYLASVTNPAGEAVIMTYSSDGLLRTLTDARKYVHHFDYDDALGRLIEDRNPAEGVITLARTELAKGHKASLTTALNRTTTYQVETLSKDEQRRINTFPDATQSTVVKGVDASHQVTLPEGTKINSSDGPDPRFGMQAPIQISQTITTPGGRKLSATATRSVKLAKPKDILSLQTQTNTVKINDRTYTTVYDAKTKTFTDTSPEGRKVTTTIDAQGRVVKEQVAGLLPVHFQYDAQGRLRIINSGEGDETRTVSLGYNDAGYIESLTDPLNQVTLFSYDLAGRVKKQTEPDKGEINFEYDGNSNLKTITPPGRPAHQFDYTPVNLIARYRPPALDNEATDTVYRYNPDRDPIRIEHPDGKTLDLTYKKTGQLDTLTTAQGKTDFAYDAKGRLGEVTVPDGGKLVLSYDGSLLTSQTWTGDVSGSVSYTYDNDFRLKELTVAGATPIVFQYDNDGLLTKAGDLILTRHPQHGLLTGTTLGAATDSWTYNGFGEPAKYVAKHGTTELFAVQYTPRDKLGRIKTKTETVQGETHAYEYQYDSVGQLIEVKQDGATLATYRYDLNGNRLSKTAGGSTLTGTYDDQDRLLSYGDATYTYTKAGELKTKTIGGQTTTYDYDIFGNLRKVILPDGKVIEYIIDGANRRVGKKVDGVLVQGFLYDGQLKPVVELDGAGKVVSYFIFATRINVPDYMIKDGVTYRIVTDHLGSPRLVINASTGAIAQRMDYDEFGNVTIDTNQGFQPFGFAGGIYDQGTKLVRFGIRNYDAKMARWLTKDPILFAGEHANLYGYAFNDPVNLSDADGRKVGIWKRIVNWGRKYRTILATLASLRTGEDALELARKMEKAKRRNEIALILKEKGPISGGKGPKPGGGDIYCAPLPGMPSLMEPPEPNLLDEILGTLFEIICPECIFFEFVPLVSPAPSA